jgi:hypothetical protein
MQVVVEVEQKIQLEILQELVVMVVYISVLSDASDFTNASTTLNNSTEVPGATVFSGTGANFIDISPNDGQGITGYAIFQEALIIFKDQSIYQLTFDDNGDPIVTPITRATGCISYRSVVAVENDVYFLSREGVRVLGNEPNYFSSIRTSVISKPIEDITDTINAQYYEYANAVYFNEQYMLAIPTTTSDISQCIVYHREFRAWSKWTNVDAESFLRYVDSNNEEKLIFLDDGGVETFTFTPGTYSDDGTAINASLTSKTFTLDAPDITKYFVDLGLIFRSVKGLVDIEVFKDGNVSIGSGETTIGSLGNDGMGIKMLGESPLGS